MVNSNLCATCKLLLISLLISVLSACSTTPDSLVFGMPVISAKPDAQNMWPRAPEVPRYIYMGDLRGESNKLKNKKEKQGAVSRFFSALVGLENRSIPLIDVLRPQHGAVDERGRIYVADPGRQAVFVFDEISSTFSIWNESEFDIPFMSPISVALAADKVLVTDSEQGLVFVFNQLGETIAKFGKNELIRPTGITYDPSQQKVYVCDTDDHNIKVFNLQGALIETIGSKGTGTGQFNRPTFLVYRNQKLYVADSLNARVQIFDLENGNIDIIGQRGLYVGNFSRPKGIALDSDGNIYITESYYDHLLIFNPEGRLLMSIGGSGQKAGQFSQPTGIWIDHKDRLFVSDMLNSRVSIFQYLGGS